MKNIFLATVLCLFAITTFGQSKRKTMDTVKSGPVTSTAFKMHYDDIFKHNVDGTISPKQILQINGEMVNTDTKIAAGAKYGGLDLAGDTGHDILVDTLRGVIIIRQVIK
ncbi:MAG: hypothetical protein ACHQHN_02115 [Sphingobacteriales bacterium]